MKRVKQRRWNFAQERNLAVVEEADKLLQTYFIEEVQYPDWTANVVMLKKVNGK
jgi:hypothetical protein